jgi:hypothetical protein
MFSHVVVQHDRDLASMARSDATGTCDLAVNLLLYQPATLVPLD